MTFKTFNLVYVLTSNALALDDKLVCYLLTVLALEIVNDFVFSVFDVFGNLLKLQTLCFFDSNLVLQFLNLGVHFCK